jgi:multiple sugar transport system permease protein
MNAAQSRRPKRIRHTLTYLILCLISVVVLFPIVWSVSTAFKSPAQQYEWPPTLIPSPIYLENFARLFEIMPMGTYLLNTFVIATSSALGMCLSSSLAAFAIARMRFRGRQLLFSILVATLMIPGAITLIPTFVIVSKLQWIDTFWPLILPNWFGGAFMIFLLRQAYRGIPQELMHAAQLDGANFFVIYLRIFTPLAMPVIVTVALLTFLFSWNDLLGPLVYLNNPALYTVQRGLSLLAGRSGTGIDKNGIIMAGSMLGMLPMLVFYLFGQRYFVQGLARTSIKG